MGFFDIFRPQSVTPEKAQPKAAFFHGNNSSIMSAWKPALREGQQDIQAAWTSAAARAVESIQNSGFVARVVDVSCGSVVGPGLRMACRPDPSIFGGDEKKASEWARIVEGRFRAYANDPKEIDAAGQMTLSQMQQAAFASYMAYGEVFGMLPMIDRVGSETMSKVCLLPPSRLADHTDSLGRWVQGVKVDGWGFPQAYRLRRPNRMGMWEDFDIQAYDADGRQNIFLVKDPAIAVTRGISPLAPVLKVVKQVDQYADATLTTAMIQTIFAATLKTNLHGLAAFDGMMTNGDTGALDLGAFAQAKNEWYDIAKIDLGAHGRIAHLMPNDELDFKEAKTPAQQYDHFMGWLMREISAGGGVTYEAATNDYRGATYSSVRMAGAIDWMTVIRRRNNIVVPFSNAVFAAWLDEEVGTGRIDFPGGYENFLRVRKTGIRLAWTGPARPQADDFKTARAYEVRKDMQATTLAEISEEYGRDWDDDMRQRKAENDLAEELGLPLPWAPVDILETKEGQELELNAPANAPDEKVDPKRPDQKKAQQRRGGGRNPPEDDPAESSLQSETDLNADLEADDGD